MFKKILNFFAKNNLIKLILAILVLTISILFVRADISVTVTKVFNFIGIMSLIYIGIIFLSLFIIAFINTINDLKNK